MINLKIWKPKKNQEPKIQNHMNKTYFLWSKRKCDCMLTMPRGNCNPRSHLEKGISKRGILKSLVSYILNFKR